MLVVRGGLVEATRQRVLFDPQQFVLTVCVISPSCEGVTRGKRAREPRMDHSYRYIQMAKITGMELTINVGLNSG